MNKKPVKRKRIGVKEFTRDYVRNSILFGYGEPTKAEINSAYISCKGSGKRKRVKRKSEPTMSKEEYFATSILGSTLLFGEPPTEEELNREWELFEIKRHYYTIRGENKRETEKIRNEFIEQKGQEMRKRDSSTQ